MKPFERFRSSPREDPGRVDRHRRMTFRRASDAARRKPTVRPSIRCSAPGRIRHSNPLRSPTVSRAGCMIRSSREGSLSPASPAVGVSHDAVLALLVDRDQDTRHMYAEVLKLDHWRVDEASDGC